MSRRFFAGNGAGRGLQRGEQFRPRMFGGAPVDETQSAGQLPATAAPVAAPQAQPTKPKDGPLGMKFVPLPKATFYMGGGGGKPGKKTEIKADFEIAIHTITQGQWQAVMGNNPSRFSRNGKDKNKVKD